MRYAAQDPRAQELWAQELRAGASRLGRLAGDTNIRAEDAIRTFAAGTAAVGPRRATRIWSLCKLLKPRLGVRLGCAGVGFLMTGMSGDDSQVRGKRRYRAEAERSHQRE